MRGLSDLHLKLMLERMRERYGVEVDTRPPRIAYRETDRRAMPKATTATRSRPAAPASSAKCSCASSRCRAARASSSSTRSRAARFPNQFIPAIEKGVRQALEHGAIAGYPMQDVRVTVYDGKYHPVDSKEVAFVTAGKKAFLDAVVKARPIVLEPIVNRRGLRSRAHMGDVTGGLAGKRARIIGTDSLRGGELVIKAQAPLAELIDYPTELKAMTGGRGRYASTSATTSRCRAGAEAAQRGLQTQAGRRVTGC